jgi:hypothetical protein
MFMQALNRRLFSLVILLIGAALPLQLHAATFVTLGNGQLDHCWYHNIACDNLNAFSLTQLENGLVQLPVNNDPFHEFVIVNDTGSPVTSLKLYFVGQISSNDSLGCGSDGWFFFYGCSIAGNDGAGHASPFLLPGPVTPPAEFIFTPNPWDHQGIPNGAYFDIQVSNLDVGGSCGHHNNNDASSISGYLTGSGNGGSGSGNPGGNSGNGNNGGPSY